MDLEAKARRFYDLMSSGDIDGLGAAMADSFVEHEETPGLVPTKEGVLEYFRTYRAAFPDMRMEPEDILVSGDKVAVRSRATGTHEGEFMGLAATGRRIDVQGIDILRFDADGRLCEHWGLTDALAMMQQLGALPESLQG